MSSFQFPSKLHKIVTRHIDGVAGLLQKIQSTITQETTIPKIE